MACTKLIAPSYKFRVSSVVGFTRSLARLKIVISRLRHRAYCFPCLSYFSRKGRESCITGLQNHLLVCPSNQPKPLSSRLTRNEDATTGWLTIWLRAEGSYQDKFGMAYCSDMLGTKSISNRQEVNKRSFISLWIILNHSHLMLSKFYQSSRRQLSTTWDTYVYFILTESCPKEI